MDEYIKFVLLTGVTKFGKVSVFSDLNNLKNISMDRCYFDICGITEEEMTTQLVLYIDRLAEANGLSHDECIAKLRKMYDGYHFSKDTVGMHNPQFKLYTLGFPNEEVKEGFLQFQMPYYSGVDAVRSPFVVSEFSRRTRNIAKVVVK